MSGKFLRPINDYVIIKPIKLSNEPKKVGELFLVDSVKNDKFAVGEVVAVGLGKVSAMGTRTLPSVSVGDTVVYLKSMTEPFQYLDINCVIADEACIQGVLEDKAPTGE